MKVVLPSGFHLLYFALKKSTPSYILTFASVL